ncbi:uncharacterized protein J8A68_000755 [[Candida] subhashii]|uniref:DNA replication regulator Sld3 C-terminal domain-containing protein n=1 Tax=[Candida] subhashii TaxID=561895 RepID=A0A8J5V124_9ASCO|nr:uncharacterized protein J8A68_000755 [[Candida] subhashii]KAG7665735.1 hypothetical protein J8A68_000755 [[Candida] subhashii]
MPNGSNSDNTTIGQIQPIPSFELTQPGNVPIVVLPLYTLTSIDITKLPFPLLPPNDSNIHSSEYGRTYILKLDSNISEQLGIHTWLVKLQQSVSDKASELGILYHIKDVNVYGLFKVPNALRIKDITGSELEPYGIHDSQELIEVAETPIEESQQPVNDHTEILDSFSMGPPKQPSDDIARDDNESPLRKDGSDPVEFIESRYYSTLYSLNNPLSYFPKTAISRLRILCDENEERICEVLSGMILSISDLDLRHGGSNGVLKLLDKDIVDQRHILKSRFEIENQTRFIEMHQELLDNLNSDPSTEFKNANQESKDKKEVSNHEKFQRLIFDLKVREAQLQILVIFELMHAWNLNETEFLLENQAQKQRELKARQKQAKSNLIRKRKRKIVPTFLGMGIDVKTDNGTLDTNNVPSRSLDQYTVYSTLNTLVDRMGLWDTLSGKADSSYGFMAYVFVPYYNKKLPELVKYVIDNMKDLNMKLETSSSSKSKKRKKSTTVTNGESEIKSQAHKSTSKSSKYRKVLLPNRKPTLSKSATTVDQSSTHGISLSGEDDIIPPSLKRSKSNLSSKNLSRRQVDLNVKLTRTTSDLETTLSSQPNVSFIFSNAKRSKSVAVAPSKPAAPTAPPEVHVMATPVKPKSFSQVQQTPVYSKSTVLVEATPQKSVTRQDTLVLKTPDAFLKPAAREATILTERLMSASKEIQATPPANKSPILIDRTPVQRSRVDSSPIKPITSIQRKTKKMRPGEPVSLDVSPFYNASLYKQETSPGLPKRSLVFRDNPAEEEDEDKEYDSDFLISPKKKVVTYSRKKRF